MVREHTERKKVVSEEENKTINNLISELKVSPENGLNDSEAKERINKYGYNELSEDKANSILKFLTYFWGPIPWMIEIAVIG